MAKIKKDIKKLRNLEIKGKIRPWFENKIEKIRSFSKPYAARAARYGTLAVVSILLLFTLSSFFLPKNRFQLAKERVLRNPKDLEAHLILAEEFLKNNQLDEAGRELREAERLQRLNDQKMEQSKVLGLNSRFEELYLRWQEENPRELEKLIKKWENIVSENPTYRDGYLYLALYYLKEDNKEKAIDNLSKAIALDPNHESIKEIEKLIHNREGFILEP